MKSTNLRFLIAGFLVMALAGIFFGNYFEPANALVEFDRDYDGIPDYLDKCPQFAETYNKFEDDDGCPDSIREEKSKFQFPDTDGDGFEDRVDKCVNLPETFNGYLDHDGCPEIIPEKPEKEIDSDFDSIPDSMDACPNEKETFNEFKDGDGCPDNFDSSTLDIASKDKGLCRDGKIPMKRVNTQNIVCVGVDTAEKWSNYGIATLVEPISEKIPDDSTVVMPKEEDESKPVEKIDFKKMINEIDPVFSSRSDKEKQNIDTVLAFLSSLVSWDKENIVILLDDGYIQHNPTMPGDKFGTIEKFDQIFSENSNSRLDIKRVYADGNYVIIHSNFQNVGKSNALIDIFKIADNGKIIEHWDVMQEIPKKPLNNNSMFYLD